MIIVNKIFINIFVFVFLFVVFGLQTIMAQSKQDFFDNIIIVKFADDFSRAKSTSKAQKLLTDFKNLSITQEFPNLKSTKSTKSDLQNIYRLEFSDNTNIFSVIKKLNSFDDVLYAEPLYIDELLYVPNDPLFVPNQFWGTKIQAIEAWNICQGDTNMVIGISDTGTDFSHSDIIYNVKYNYNDPINGEDDDDDGYVDNFRGWDLGDNDNNPQYETNNHGLTVSSIASASTNNGIGIAGAGFKCKFLPIKTANKADKLVNTYRSIVYAAEHGCKVVNCSWGSPHYQQMAQDIINFVVKEYDLLVVAACGNTNSESEFYPASYENVLSVSGTDPNDERWSPDNSSGDSGSSYSYSVDVAAPCVGFSCATPNNSYTTIVWSGTSFAAPIVSGCAGIIRSYYPNFNANQIKEVIRNSTDLIDTIPYNQQYAEKLGSGRINLYKALAKPLKPAIRFHNMSINYNENIVTINGIFTNYLSTAENAKVILQLYSDDAELQNTNISLGTLSELESYLSENEIIINVFESATLGQTATLKFIFVSQDTTTIQNIYVKLKKEWVDISTDLMTLSATGKGRLGYTDLNGNNGNGLSYEGDPLFVECSIIAGYNDANVISSSQKISDFKTITAPYLINVPTCSLFDNDAFCEFTDAEAPNPLGLKIQQTIHAKNGKDYADFFIVDYHIINSSIKKINNFYFGLFTDWDLINEEKNSSHLIENKDFMYCQSANGINMYAGIKLLSSQQVHNYSISTSDAGSGLINMTDGFSNTEKMHIISNNYNYSDTSDIAICTSAGPFNIDVGDTVLVSFAIIASNNIYDFSQAIENAETLYYCEKTDGIPTNHKSNLLIVPNISDKYISVKYFEQNENCFYQIFNSVGNITTSKEFHNYETINIEHLKSGLYILVIYDGNKVFYGKFLKK